MKQEIGKILYDDESKKFELTLSVDSGLLIEIVKPKIGDLISNFLLGKKKDE